HETPDRRAVDRYNGSQMRWTPALAGLLLCFACRAQEAVAPQTLTLERVKAKMADNLRRLPNYTCSQTIERSKRRQPSSPSELVDTLRLEVALVDGKELFSLPGAAQFEEKEIREFASEAAAIGDGAFALQARSLFLTGSPEFT